MEVPMCFGPSSSEKKAAQEQRDAAAAQKQEAVRERTRRKAEDIDTAVTDRESREGRRGGSGRRSLMTNPMGGSGYASRF